MASETVTELRQPESVHIREIHQHLTAFYDDKAGRYKDGATDKTLSEMIGNGCLPGWVGNIRGEHYGPDGSNADMANLVAELETLRVDMEARAEAALIAIHKFEGGIVSVLAMEKRLAAIIKAVGPKAGRT